MLHRSRHRLRPDRNALTHGAYTGKLASGEYFFHLAAHTLIEAGRPSAYKLRVFTAEQIAKHLSEIAQFFIEIIGIVMPKNKVVMKSHSKKNPCGLAVASL